MLHFKPHFHNKCEMSKNQITNLSDFWIKFYNKKAEKRLEQQNCRLRNTWCGNGAVVSAIVPIERRGSQRGRVKPIAEMLKKAQLLEEREVRPKTVMIHAQKTSMSLRGYGPRLLDEHDGLVDAPLKVAHHVAGHQRHTSWNAQLAKKLCVYLLKNKKNSLPTSVKNLFKIFLFKKWVRIR